MGSKLVTLQRTARLTRLGLVRLTSDPTDAADPVAIAETDPRVAGRRTASVTTAELDPMERADVEITLAKATELLRTTTDYPAWVCIYSSAAERTADATRDIDTAGVTGTGFQAEIFTQPNLSVPSSPKIGLWNDDSPITSTFYLAVMNLDSVARAITVTLEHLPREV